MKMLAKLWMVGILAFAVLQLVRPSIPVGAWHDRTAGAAGGKEHS
jgi:hypothetical protein